MNRISDFFKQYAVEILLVTAGLTLLFMLLWFQLGALTGGNAAAVEIASAEAAVSWQKLLANPLYGPYTIMQRLVYASGYDSLSTLRLVTTVWAVLAIVLFYIVARGWHSTRVAGLATWLFITSAWFLHTARLATPEVLLLVAILALVVLFSPNRDGRRNALALPVLLLSVSLILYVPGMVWLVLLSLILRRKNVQEAWQSSRGAVLRSLSILVGLCTLIPLLRAFVLSPQLVLPWLGWSQTYETPLTIVKQFLSVPKQLFVAGPLDPVHWLGRTPLLSIFELVMFSLGVYFYATHLRAARAKFILILSLAAWLVIGIGGQTSLSLIVPVVYLIVTTGIAYMLKQWLVVFPNNPIARALGIAVILAAVLLTSVYQTRSYFVAWRYSPETAKVFSRPL